MADPHQPGATATFSHEEIRSVVLGIMLAMFLAALDQTVIATALPSIGADLQDITNLSWVVTAYLLTSTAVTPLYGKLSDIHGRGPVMVCAIALFTLGSIACALAPSMLVLVLARGLQGLGGGGLISLAQTIIADVVPPRERGRYQAQIASVFAASSIGGPLIGGFIAQHVHWSFIFWINLPLGLGAYLMMRSIMPRLPQHARPHKLDLLGAFLLMGTATSLLLVLTWGGVTYSWTSLRILGLIGIFAFGSLAFVVRMRLAPEPFLPLEILSNQVVATGIGAAFFVFGNMVALSIVAPLYFETVWQLSSSAAGVALIPQMGGVVVGAVTGGRLMSKLTRYKRPALAGLALASLLLAFLAAGPDLPLWGLVLVLGVSGIGMGTVLPVSTVAIQNAVQLHQLGTATGAANFFRSLGAALLVAVYGAVLLGSLGLSQQGDLGALTHGLDPAALRHAFRLVFGVSAGVLGLGFLFLLAMRELPLRGHARAAAEEGAALISD